MNNKVNYTLIGFLVIFGVGLVLFFGYWLLKPSNESEVKSYKIYFNESVLGLNLDAPVKYKGLNVGRVTKLSINPKNQEQIEVIVELLSTTPIMTSTVAQLTSQGITGLSYINLSLGDDIRAKPLVSKDNDEYPVIKTIPSLLIKLENSFSDIVINFEKTLQKMQLLLNEENQKNFSLLLENSAALSGKINSTLDEETIKNVQLSIKNLQSTTAQLDAMMPKIQNLVEKTTEWEDSFMVSFRSIMNSYAGIKNSMQALKLSIESGEFNLKEITSDVIPTINNTFLETQQLMLKMQELIDRYERSPADAFLIQEKIKKGPGEE
jgi:phospholipid/cholesterol/gamma-HCH transport system substrate-binding protein